MVTPFDADGALDLEPPRSWPTQLVELGNDGLVVNGTTGESPTTTDAEKAELVRAVVDAVGDRATVVAGVGTYDTAHWCSWPEAAEKAGAHGAAGRHARTTRGRSRRGCSRTSRPSPTPPACRSCCTTSRRAAWSRSPRTPCCRLAEHPRITAVKDAKGDLPPGAQVIASSDLAYYSGDDPLTLPWLAVGAVGFVSIIGHVVADACGRWSTAFEAGDVRPRPRDHTPPLLPADRAHGPGRRCGLRQGRAAAARLRRRRSAAAADPRPTTTQMRAIAADLAAAGLPVALPS